MHDERVTSVREEPDVHKKDARPQVHLCLCVNSFLPTGFESSLQCREWSSSSYRQGRSLHEESMMLSLIIEALDRNRGLHSPPLAERDRWKLVNFPGEESEVEALLNCVSTSYACCCEFGMPCDCSQGITGCWTIPTDFISLWCGHTLQLSEFPRRRFRSSSLSHANKPWTF